jgi:dihydropteroate synthase
MGILNITPDSFYEGSRVLAIKDILKAAEKMLKEGADFLDIGGFSSRPGAAAVTEQEEIDRVVRPITAIKKEFPEAILSLDTFRAGVAQAGIDCGAGIINDISAGNADPNMYKLIAKEKVTYIIMHMRGYVTGMMENTKYKNLVKEVMDYFHQKINMLNSMGIYEVVIDPGFGFSKSLDQNYEILNNLQYFNMTESPLLVGLSRKSMIYKFLKMQPEEALVGTNVLNFVALQKGARILRVHDVKEAKETIQLFKKLSI